MDISIDICDDTNTIRAFVSSCFHDIVEPGVSEDAIEHIVYDTKKAWLRITCNGVVSALFELTPKSSTVVELHPYVLKQFRNLSAKICLAVMKWFDNEAPAKYLSLYTTVASDKRNALWTANLCGFRKIGAIKDGFKTDSGYCDTILLQRTRKWEA